MQRVLAGQEISLTLCACVTVVEVRNVCEGLTRQQDGDNMGTATIARGERDIPAVHTPQTRCCFPAHRNGLTSHVAQPASPDVADFDNQGVASMMSLTAHLSPTGPSFESHQEPAVSGSVRRAYIRFFSPSSLPSLQYIASSRSFPLSQPSQIAI